MAASNEATSARNWKASAAQRVADRCVVAGLPAATTRPIATSALT